MTFICTVCTCTCTCGCGCVCGSRRRRSRRGGGWRGTRIKAYQKVTSVVPEIPYTHSLTPCTLLSNYYYSQELYIITRISVNTECRLHKNRIFPSFFPLPVLTFSSLHSSPPIYIIGTKRKLTAVVVVIIIIIITIVIGRRNNN